MLRRSVSGAAAVSLVALVAATPAATAGVPGWGAPQVVDSTADGGQVLVRGDGDVVVVDIDDGQRLVMRRKQAGAAQFGPPVVVNDQAMYGFQLAGNEAGATALLLNKNTCSPPSSCPGGLWLRFGEPGRALDEPVALTSEAHRAVVDVGARGDAAVAWQTGRLAMFGETSTVGAAFRSRNGTVGRRVLSDPALGQAVEPSVAVNDDGAAVVAWSQFDEGHGSRIMASYRAPGAAFGPPETVFSENSTGHAHGATVAIDDGGEATVLFEAEAKRVAVKPPKGDFGPSAVIERGGGAGRLIANRSGALVAFWSDVQGTEGFAAAKRQDGTFGRPTAIGAQPVAWTHAALDSEGNLATAGITRPGTGQIPYTAVFSRFGFAPEVVSPALGPGESGIQDIASNDAGQVAALFTTYPPGWGGGPGTLSIVERQADSRAPALAVMSLRIRRGRVVARVKCRGERCRVRGRVRLRGLRLRAAASASTVKTLKPGQTAKLRFGLTRRTKKRVVRALRVGRRIRARLVLRAEDAAGNARERRRAVRVRRLLR